MIVLVMLIYDQTAGVKTSEKHTGKKTVIDYYNYEPRPVDISAEGTSCAL